MQRLLRCQNLACRQVLRVPSEYFGQNAQCVFCDNVFRIPQSVAVLAHHQFTDEEQVIIAGKIGPCVARELTPDELLLLVRNLSHYDALDTEKLKPRSAADVHFVAVCRSKSAPVTVDEIAYAHFRRLRAQQWSSAEIFEWAYSQGY